MVDGAERVEILGQVTANKIGMGIGHMAPLHGDKGHRTVSLIVVSDWLILPR